MCIFMHICIHARVCVCVCVLSFQTITVAVNMYSVAAASDVLHKLLLPHWRCWRCLTVTTAAYGCCCAATAIVVAVVLGIYDLAGWIAVNFVSFGSYGGFLALRYFATSE